LIWNGADLRSAPGDPRSRWHRWSVLVSCLILWRFRPDVLLANFYLAA
jgi:hypothetical protein